MKSWVQELYKEFNFYDYKGHKVISKTEDQKRKIAKDNKDESDQRQSEALKDGILLYPLDLFLLTSHSEQSVDEQIEKDKKDKIELEKSYSKSYISTPRKPKRKDIHNTIMQSVSSFVNKNKVRKKAFIKSIVELNPDISELVIKRRIRKLFKQRFIEIDKTFKTKPFVIKGHYWRAVWF